MLRHVRHFTELIAKQYKEDKKEWRRKKKKKKCWNYLLHTAFFLLHNAISFFPSFILTYITLQFTTTKEEEYTYSIQNMLTWECSASSLIHNKMLKFRRHSNIFVDFRLNDTWICRCKEKGNFLLSSIL